MSITVKRRVAQVGSALFVLLCLIGLFWPVFLMVGCAGQATSDITPARSDAQNESLFVSAPTRSFTEITVTIPPAQRVGYEVVDPVVIEEEGEDK